MANKISTLLNQVIISFRAEKHESYINNWKAFQKDVRNINLLICWLKYGIALSLVEWRRESGINI